MIRQIIALDGGGFLMEPDKPIFRWLHNLTSRKGKSKKNFIGTASGEMKKGIACFENESCFTL